MTSPSFAAALPFVLRWEGGFVDHPADPGGATNRGVTQAVYNQWRARQGLPQQSVRHLADNELHQIYEGNYWVPPRCPALPEPLDLVQFDTAVNMGVGRAIRLLQQAVGAKVDGDFGSNTAQCVVNCDTGQALVAYCDAREAFYRGLAARKPQMRVFLKGWLNRLNALRKQAGLPGFEAASEEVDFGDAAFMKRVPESEDDDDVPGEQP